ncbi:hypothetical protein [Geotalea toluenoxydans]|uniref:hypothetical protein n=1 Tax=Geotalea toluenoxydans TaxID=421624 RepID=UPI0006D03DA3|nr:hypothetical protein [Geotalea toluenoxydans]
MNNKIFSMGIMMIAALFVFCVGASWAIAAEPATAKQVVEKKELRISADGNAIVDQDGREVARFANDIQLKQPSGASMKLQGCMCCTPECLVYDKNGNCIKTYNSCTWDFDCSCK